MADNTLSEELQWRGFANQTTYKDMQALDAGQVTFYWGVDPSADSMTIGNLAAAMMVKCFIKHGHKPVLLVGGATGMIGDPDGKAQERDLLSAEELDHNKQAIIAQYHRVFGDSNLEIVDNYDWFKDMHYLDFLREVGKHVPMRQMLARDFVQSRLGEEGTGISYAEFSYVLIQAYDFLKLHENHGVTLQLCGSDQWGNSIAGVDLIRRKTGAEAHVYSSPLVINKATGQKFGKTEDGAIWLDPAKTTPTQFYQFWINADDEGVEDYLKVYTELSKNEINDIMQAFHENKAARLAQRRLAYEVTNLVHGEKAAVLAAEDAERRAEGSVKEIDSFARIGDSIVDVLVRCGLAQSKSEARQLLADRGVYINGQVVTHDAVQAEDFEDEILLIRRGKKFQNMRAIERKND
jgi:tyrosyl-tRNA synthetase